MTDSPARGDGSPLTSSCIATSNQTGPSSSEQADGNPTEPVFDSLDASQDVVGKLIESQVTGLVECLREAVQNGTDKPSADYVGVVTTSDDAIVYDNGEPLDFSTEADRSKFLELGSSVKDYERDHVVGEHGLGSATLMSMGALRVWSGDTILCIDYKNRFDEGPFADIAGYRTVTVPADETVDGVLVHCQFYTDAVSLPYSHSVRNKADELRETLAFRPFRAGTDIWVNGTPVEYGSPEEFVREEATDDASSGDAPEVIVNETDDAFVAVSSARARTGLKKNSKVDVYSNGIYVESKDVRGLSGIVVTKQNLQLPISRSSIKQDCPVWDRIEGTLQSLANDLIDRSRDTELSEGGRMLAASKLLSRPTVERRSRSIFSGVDDTRYSYDALADAPGIGFTSVTDRAGDRLHEETDYIVLSEDDDANSKLSDALLDEELPQQLPDINQVDVFDTAVEMDCIEQAALSNEQTLSPRQEDRRAFIEALFDQRGCALAVEYDLESDSDEHTPAAWTDNSEVLVVSDDVFSGQQWVVWTHEALTTVVEQLAYDEDTRRVEDPPMGYQSTYYRELANFRPHYRELLEEISRDGLRTALADYHRHV